MLWPKKIHTRNEKNNEKKFLRLENSPPPPHNFSNGPSLTDIHVKLQSTVRIKRMSPKMPTTNC